MPDRLLDEFSDQMMALLTAASKKEIVVEVPNQAKAVSLRYRFYHLRAKVKSQGQPHQRHLLKTQAIITVNEALFNPAAKNKPTYPPDSVWKVICSPSDADVNKYITLALSEQGEGLEDEVPFLPGGEEKIDTLPDDYTDQAALRGEVENKS